MFLLVCLAHGCRVTGPDGRSGRVTRQPNQSKCFQVILPHQTTISFCLEALCAGDCPCSNSCHRVRNAPLGDKSVYAVRLRDWSWSPKYTEVLEKGSAAPDCVVTSCCSNTKEETRGKRILWERRHPTFCGEPPWLQATRLNHLSTHTEVSHDPQAFL